MRLDAMQYFTRLVGIISPTLSRYVRRNRSSPTKVYCYDDGRTHYSAVPTSAIIAAFGSIAEFETFFGGGVTYGSPSHPKYLGVWGRRNSSRLRRIVREAAGPIEIIDSEPPARMTNSRYNGHRLTRSEREAIILRMQE